MTKAPVLVEEEKKTLSKLTSVLTDWSNTPEDGILMLKHVYVSIILNYINKNASQFHRALSRSFNLHNLCWQRSDSLLRCDILLFTF
jgi:hypothetical protein